RSGRRYRPGADRPADLVADRTPGGSWMNYLFVTVVLIVLHSVDNLEVIVNPEESVVMGPSSEAAKGTPNQLIVTGVHCIIGLTNGKFVSVVEPCDRVRALIEKSETIKK